MNIPTEFAAVRPLVIQRAHGLCEGCGAVPPTEVHHRQPRAMGGVHGDAVARANSPANLLALCVTCHRYTEDQPERARQLGWLVPHPTDPATVAARIYPIYGHGWYFLTPDLGYVLSEAV